MKQVVILDSDRAPDKREWEVMIPPNLASLTRGAVENINGQNCIYCDENPITSSVVVVHWSQISLSLIHI